MSVCWRSAWDVDCVLVTHWHLSISSGSQCQHRCCSRHWHLSISSGSQCQHRCCSRHWHLSISSGSQCQHRCCSRHWHLSISSGNTAAVPDTGTSTSLLVARVHAAAAPHTGTSTSFCVHDVYPSKISHRGSFVTITVVSSSSRRDSAQLRSASVPARADSRTATVQRPLRRQEIRPMYCTLWTFCDFIAGVILCSCSVSSVQAHRHRGVRWMRTHPPPISKM